MIREIEPGSWKLINNTKFNNLEEDHFRRTSLHLSFTNFYRPLDLSLRGEQDIRVGLLECITSVHDAGKWVADVDILATVRSPKIIRISDQQHMCGSSDDSHSKEIISLENWDEILDMPGSISVIRARGNSSARLAVASVLAQLQSKELTRKIWICPPKGKICCFCPSISRKAENDIYVY